MRPELFERLAPYLTVYSGRNAVNLKYAPPWLFSALTSTEREAADSPSLQETQPAGPFHITAWATSTGGSRASVEAVLSVVPTDEEPYRVLSWREPARSRKLTPG